MFPSVFSSRTISYLSTPKASGMLLTGGGADSCPYTKKTQCPLVGEHVGNYAETPCNPSCVTSVSLSLSTKFWDTALRC